MNATILTSTNDLVAELLTAVDARHGAGRSARSELLRLDMAVLRLGSHASPWGDQLARAKRAERELTAGR